MSKKFAMRSLGLILALGGMPISNVNVRNDFDDYAEPRLPEKKSEKAKRFGLKEWNINGKTVFAATKKKAEKLALR